MRAGPGAAATGRAGPAAGRGRPDHGGVGRRDRERGGGGREPDDQGGGRQATVHVRRTIPRSPPRVPSSDDPRTIRRRPAACRRPPPRWPRRVGPAAPTDRRAASSSSSSPSRGPTAPIELTRIGKWVERVPELRLDGERPTSKAVAARLAAFWLPSQPVLYIGASETLGQPAGRRDRGDRPRRPPAVLRRPLAARPDDAGRDARLVGGDDRGRGVRGRAARRVRRRDRRTPSGRPSPTATSSCRSRTCAGRPVSARRPDSPGRSSPSRSSRRTPPTRIVDLPDGDAEGADGSPPPKRGRPPASRRPAPGARPGRSRRRRPRRPPASRPPATARLTAEGAARLRAELDELIKAQRPEVVARIRVGQGARRPQGERRVPRPRARSRASSRAGSRHSRRACGPRSIVEPRRPGARIGLGSAVSVRIDGDEVELTIVGSSESNPADGPDLVGVAGGARAARPRGRRRGGRHDASRRPVYQVVSVA